MRKKSIERRLLTRVFLYDEAMLTCAYYRDDVQLRYDYWIRNVNNAMCTGVLTAGQLHSTDPAMVIFIFDSKVPSANLKPNAI